QAHRRRERQFKRTLSSGVLFIDPILPLCSEMNDDVEPRQGILGMIHQQYLLKKISWDKSRTSSEGQSHYQEEG
ncbi:hypothetical protein ADUPG1_002894, partial [Aduncisulcus paluster]